MQWVCTHAHTHIQIHTHARAHTYTYAHTHTHTHDGSSYKFVPLMISLGGMQKASGIPSSQEMAYIQHRHEWTDPIT